MASEPDTPLHRDPTLQSGAAAADTLQELRVISSRSRRAATSDLMGRPLAAWGVAWIAGFCLLDLAPWRIAVPAGAALGLAAAIVTWLSRSPNAARSGWEHRIRIGWLALFLCSPFLVASVGPLAERVQVIFLGALWGLAMLLYAVATGDVALGCVGGITLVAAAFCRPVLHHQSLLGFGICAGGAMLALGGWRIARPALRRDQPAPEGIR